MIPFYLLLLADMDFALKKLLKQALQSSTPQGYLLIFALRLFK